MPDPEGELSRSMPSHFIARANAEVARFTRNGNEPTGSRKKTARGPYIKLANIYCFVCVDDSLVLAVLRYDAENRAKIAKYAAMHGITRASSYFSRKFGTCTRASEQSYSTIN